MKLDRYSTGIPRFRVFRHVERTEDGAPPPGVRSFETDEGEAYMEVDPWECFVLKRRDCFSETGLLGYADAALALGQRETAGQIKRLRRDWLDLTAERGDGKIPD